MFMKDWIFPSISFFVFIYGVVFVGLYIYDYKNSDVSVFSDTQVLPTSKRDIDNFLKEISDSFK